MALHGLWWLLLGLRDQQALRVELELQGQRVQLPAVGRLARVIIKDGATTVFDADFTTLQDDTYAFRESSVNNAVVYASSNGSTGAPAGRTVKNFIVNNKTLPGSTLTLQGGGGGILLIAGSSSPSHTHGYPALVSTGGKWLASGDSSYGIQQFSAITWTTSATGPRNSLIRGPAATASRWSSGGLVTVNYADVLWNDADGASIPFSNVNGLLYGTTDWIDENIYPDYIILGMQD